MILKLLSKFWKELLIVALFFLLLFSISTCSTSVSALRSDVSKLHEARDSAFSKAKRVENKNGELVSRVRTQELEIDQLNDLGSSLGYEIKTLEKRVGKLKNLVAYWEGQATASDSAFRPVSRLDSLEEDADLDLTFDLSTDKEGVSKLNWNNGNLVFEAEVRNDSVFASYEYDLDFYLTSYYIKKRQGLFKRKKLLVADIYFSDPNLKVDKFKGVVIPKPERKGFLRRVMRWIF